LGRLSSLVSRFEWKDPKDTDVKAFRTAGFDLADRRIVKFLQLYRAVQDLPRHLGQHSGGMVVCQGQLDAVVPLEPASMPGPVVGNMVHPYLKRRAGREAPECLHPSLEPILRRTLGVPLFQEQLLRMAMVAAGFSGGEAEELRRAFGFKRSERRMKDVEVKLRQGMNQNGITGEVQDQIIHSITSFALYGFPESHAASFALIAYASAVLKCHYL